MNKKEINEIKKQLKMDNEDITINNIGIYYINKDNEIVCSDIKKFAYTKDMENGYTGNNKYWGQIDEENLLEIFKKTLNGQVGKGLVEYSFPNEILMEKDNCYTKLLDILEGDFESKTEVDKYVSFLAQTLNKNEEYTICLINCLYLLPTRDINGFKTKDINLNIEREEYHFMIVSICPMTLTKIGLYYDKENTRIVHKENIDKILEMPTDGFLFPVFNDRKEDINGVLVFNKKFKEPNLSLIQSVLGCNFIMNAEEEKEKFNTLITKVISKSDDTNTSIDYEITKSIHSIISDKITKSVLDTETPTLSRTEIKSILEKSGVSKNNLDDFDEIFDEVIPDERYQFKAVNVINAEKLDIKSPDIIINVKSDKTDKIKARQIDGKRCLVVELDETVNINGLNVNIK